MLYVVLFFLMFSLLLYVILAGADFGAGIVELFSSQKNRHLTKKTVYRVMGPVWEANHIWIILMIVILWVGFPNFYNVLVVYLHIPLTLILLGITLRGVAFVFRHYDAYQDQSQILYDWMFRISSLITPIFLGMTFGAMVSGQIVITEDYTNFTFYSLFIQPWLNGFSVLVGLFFAALCAFLATILLIGEVDENTPNIYLKKAKIATLVVVISGFLVLSFGFVQEVYFITNFMQNSYSLGLVALSAVLIFPLLYSIKKEFQIASRTFAGIQVVLVLIAAIIAHFPNLIITTTSEISLLETTATDEVISVLGISLIIGGAIILPGLFHLFKSFNMIKILE
ncbi:cytochrome bd-I ubiquinol oxidase subunit 2 apoprotein [Gillisia mitskevichiae]|uniref:Cytochrome bd-I ubiquinol oxidase subunit 2 apoprotein n=1 Tax=Gillisia mitskevichiae TaxID=270921 RepID=A0A495PV55_9FLAO|nr:cytochrome d ubiquinol oxidase subunit II [Gillisia mitskevichiae]RKS53660.1 cytochrome bd-I ubiquinol oxidase subunit 2 apoprotein [Gillisia mitskevichiae]